ncbi:hypothetical protein [Streptomyces javensis]|uniref:hypothetical protein n=1 Tax=Streptomyces javensis TaxID=114698 RepID=UPI002811C330|nr:hypothetical protein [Streptomyces javensis]
MRALLDTAGLTGAVDAVRLAVIVLASRTPSETGEVEIRTGELARWLGMSASYVASDVLPALRASGVVSVDTAEGEYGQDNGLKCQVLPLWAAQGVVGHPLNLSKKEYATLLRLVEAVMAPGWKHRDGRVTPAGLIGARTGRGAATDRLALLLLALEARQTGRVRQCGGVVDSKRGRAAVTVARLLGCSASAGERVLERLENLGLVRRVRLQTSSGLANRSRLMVPVVAAAHGRTVADDVRGDRAEALEPEFSDPDVAAGPGEPSEPERESQVSSMPVTDVTGVAEPDVAAALHTDHPHLVAPVVPPQLSGGFSGEGRGGKGPRPERAYAREDQAVDSETASAGSALMVAEDGPLRGEKPKESPVEGRDGQRAAGAEAGGQPKAVGWDKAQRQRRVGLPADLGLRVALGPVAWLWERLNGWQQEQVEAAAKRELGRLKNLLMQPDAAPQLLADRLTDRLEEIGGEALVRSPYSWLIRRGLVQRPACPDGRCDDGIRLDSGGDCENCRNVIHLRRARRARIAAQIDRELPGLDVDQRRQVLEDRLRQQAAIEAEDVMRRREQAAAEQARRDAARAAAQERAERERAAEAAADAVRRALPCEDCGQERAAGLCEACGYRRRTEALTVEAGLVAAAWSADLDDPDDVAAVTACVRASLETDIATAQRAFMELVEPGELDADPVAAAAALAFAALQVVQQEAPEYRRCALEMLGRTAAAEAEARQAYGTALRNRPVGALEDEAESAAAQVAWQARQRTAEHLLTTQLAQLREATRAMPEPADDGPVCAGCGKDVRRVTPGGLCLGCEQVRFNREVRGRGPAVA